MRSDLRVAGKSDSIVPALSSCDDSRRLGWNRHRRADMFSRKFKGVASCDPLLVSGEVLAHSRSHAAWSFRKRLASAT
jgi:hypothetical protein